MLFAWDRTVHTFRGLYHFSGPFITNTVSSISVSRARRAVSPHPPPPALAHTVESSHKKAIRSRAV